MPSALSTPTQESSSASRAGASRIRLGRIERYVLRELAAPLVLTFVMASVLLLSGEFLTEVIDKWLNRGLSVGVALQVMYFLIPPLFIFTLPVALLLAVLITFGRLSEDHEIVAMQAAGISWGRLFGPVILIGVVATLFNTWLANTVIPRSKHQSRSFLVHTMLSNPTLMLEAQTWLREVEGMHVWIGSIDDANGELADLRIYRDDGHGGTQTITAASGRVDVDPAGESIILELREGAMHQVSASDPGSYELLKFKTIRIPFPVYAIERWAARASGMKLSEKPLGELVRDLRESRVGPRRFWMEFGKRTAMPFACLSFVLVGAPLSIRPHKSLRAYGAGICIALVLAFYLLYTLGQTLSREGTVHPLVGLWLPDVFLGTAGAIAMVRLWRR